MDTTIIQLKNGGERAFKAIVEAYWGRLYRFSLIYIKEEEVAKEIVQDTFLVLWNEKMNLTADTSLIKYLMVVNRNKCLNHLKSLKLQTVDLAELEETSIYKRASISILEDDSLDLLITKELSEKIKASLDRLPEKTREIFLMSRNDDMKNKEIAAAQSISVKAVEFHISKALKQLRKDLNSDYLFLILLAAMLWWDKH